MAGAPANPIDPGTRIGHVHLKVADLDRALGFYCDVLGFSLKQRMNGAAFIAAGAYHHHIGVKEPGRAAVAAVSRPGSPTYSDRW